MRFNRVVLSVAACAGLLLMTLALGARGAAAAESPFRIQFDSSAIQVNVLKDLPLDALSTKASIEGTIDEAGNVTVPEGGFKLPELGLTEPVAVKGYMGIEGPATGRFDAATGQLDLDAEAGLWVSVNVQQLLGLAEGFGLDTGGSLGDLSPYIGLIGEDLTCGFAPMDVRFSTEPNSLTAGKRFADGPGGAGAISAEWSKLGPFAGKTKVLGFVDVCKLIQTQLPTLLEGIGGGGTGGFDLGSLLGGLDLTDLDDLDLGPSAITLTRTTVDPPGPTPPVEPEAPSAAKLRLSVTPKTRQARAGSKVRYRATVSNVGGSTAAGVKVCVQVPKKAARVKRCQSLGKLAAGARKSRRFNLKLKRSAKHKSYRIGFEAKSLAGDTPARPSRLRIR